MSTVYSVRKHALFSVSFLVLFLLAFLFAGCGKTSTGGSGTVSSNPTTTPTQVPTLVKGYGSANGCPSDLVVSTTPTKANVMLQPSDANTPITAHTGDVIEVRLPFGHKWAGPLVSQSVLQLQSPAGYAWKTNNVCVWRFVASGTGSAQLNFTGQALCKHGQMCPMFIVAVPFKITVK